MAQKIRFSGHFGPPSKVFAETARQKGKVIVVELTNQKSVVQFFFLMDSRMCWPRNTVAMPLWPHAEHS